MLVVEDEPALREMYRKILTGAGFAVTAVEDGVDALQQLDNQSHDAVVLDLALPRA